MKPVSKRIIIFSIAFLILIAFSALLLGNSLTNLSTAGIVQGASLNWEKTYGGSGDDRAFFAVATTDGYLVV
jgi:hypothetical protein